MHLTTNAAIFIGCLACCIATSPSYQESSSPSKTPRFRLDYGTFSFDVFFNETNTRSRLRLSKSYFKVLANANLPSLENPLGGYRVTNIEELVSCDNLTLVKPEYESLIDCKPLDQHLLDQTHRDRLETAGPNRFVRRFVIKNKNKFAVLAQKNLAFVYPLREDVIQENIKSIVAESNVSQLNFVKPGWDLGYYFENQLNQYTDYESRCTGEFYWVVNRTSIFTPLKSPEIPDFIQAINYLAGEARDNGYLLSLKNLSCGSDLEFVMNFTICQKMEFPYLTVRHTMRLEPYQHLFNYDANVTQYRDPETTDVFKYNTSIAIKSKSILDLLTFKLDQDFTNENMMKGFEHMLMTSSWGLVIVQGSWAAGELKKLFRLLEFNEDLSIHKIIQFLHYYDPEDEMMHYSLEVAKPFYRRLTNLFKPATPSTLVPVEVSDKVTIMLNVTERDEL